LVGAVGVQHGYVYLQALHFYLTMSMSISGAAENTRIRGFKAFLRNPDHHLAAAHDALAV